MRTRALLLAVILPCVLVIVQSSAVHATRSRSAVPAVVTAIHPGTRASTSPSGTVEGDLVCLPGSPTCPPPDITITPGGGTFASASRSVIIDWCGHAPLMSATRHIVLNGADVTSSFSYVLSAKAGCSSHAASTGTIQLATGANTLSGYIEDNIAQGGSNAASYTLTVAGPPPFQPAPPPPAPPTSSPTPPTLGTVVSVTDANPGANRDRDQCFTVSGGTGIAYECGDLRLAHGFPGAQTYGTVRAMGMLYNSRAASATPVLAANVRTPAAVGTPTRVVAELLVGPLGGAMTSRSIGDWTAGDFTPSSIRRIALADAGAGDPSGVYTYQIGVTFYVNGTVVGTYWSEIGEFVHVNRSTSPYGPGWWPAGVEQLFDAANGDKAWVGADGSTRHYVKRAGENVWDAGAVDRPDYLSYDGTNYVRWVPNRTRILFNTQGQHVATVNRYGRQTSIAYVAGQLDNVTVPGLTVPLYQFSYSGTSTTITAAPASSGHPRVTTITRDADGVRAICDSLCTSYAYLNEGGELHLKSVSNLRGTRTDFTYIPGYFLRGITADAAGSPSTRSFAPVGESRGMAVPGGVASSTLATDQFTTASGPRGVGDYIAAYLNRFGAPTVLTNAAVTYTSFVYGDARFPGLVTRVTSSSGFVTDATYDPNGHLLTSIARNPHDEAPAKDATTTYTWDSIWDHVTSVTLPEGERTSIAYNAATGDPLWVAAHGDTTRFTFSTPGLMASSQTSEGAVDRFGYDGLLNTNFEQEPSTASTSTTRDWIGRPLTITTSSDAPTRTQTFRYDAMSRVDSTADYAGSDTLMVRAWYAADGLIDSVSQWARPVRVSRLSTLGSSAIRRSYRYDALGRSTAEYGDAQLEKSWRYDRQGNVIAGSMEAGDSLVYDAANRLVQRLGGPDSARYSYDPNSGALTSASNAFAKLRRGFYSSGDIKWDSTWVADRNLQFGAGDGFSVSYDGEGRRTQLILPAAIGRTVGYTYDTGASGTGQVKTVDDGSIGGLHKFSYDTRGRLKELVRRSTGSTPITETLGYNSDSRLTSRYLGGGGTTYFNDAPTWDQLGRTSTHTRYDPLGHVRYHAGVGGADSVLFDAFTNRIHHEWSGQRPQQTDYIFEDGQNRVVKEWESLNADYPDTTRYGYTGDGSLEMTETLHIFGFGQTGYVGATDTGSVRSFRLNTYRSGKMVRSEFTKDTSWINTTTTHYNSTAYRSNESYRYDALGRRIWQRMVFPDYRCARVEPATTCVSSVITTVWDGGDILLEHRMHSDSGYVSAAAGQFGDVAYVHGLQTDRPLVVMKAGDHDVLPFTNTDDGKFVNGACPDIKCASSDVDFPMGRMPMYGAPPVWVSGAKWYGAPLNGMVDGSGLVYQRNRYLDPRTGLFTQEDPIGLAGGMNLYGFAGGDPVNFSDPFGLCPPEDSKACPWMHEEGLQSGGWADPIAWLSGGIGAGIERGLASVGTKAVASAGARVAANKVAGDAFRDEIASAFESNGYGVAKEVGKRTPFGRRVIDVEVSRNGEVLGGIEAKAGKSRYLPWQMAKDEYLRRAGYPVQLVRDATAVKVSGLP